MSESNTELPRFPEPYWRESLTFPSFPKLEKDLKTDILIVGAGITGITSAYLLSKAGKKVTLIDGSEILNGTTGHTTAKITSQHGAIYDQLISKHGKEKARLYYEANQEGMELIKTLIKEHSIDCGLTSQDAYLYADSDEGINKVEKERDAYEQLGIPSEYVDKIPLSIPCKAALVMKGQAQFHPLKYLMGLIPTIQEAGGEIYERTTAMKIDEDDTGLIVQLENGHKITSNQIVVASHYPFNDEMGLYFARMHVSRSYVLGIKMKQEYPGGMYDSADTPSRSLRYTVDESGKQLILVSGNSHKTGQGKSMIHHYEELQNYSLKYFDVESIPYRWSAQDIVTPDNLPYVGPVTSGHPNVQIATGFRKWGMTNGSISAKIMTDRILQKENRFAKLYDPNRIGDLATIIKDNADVAKHMIKGKFSPIHQAAEDLKNDEGAVIKVNGERTGCYRDKEGQLHMVDSTCTHMGCEVAWNSGERTWDCPCHGSRFSISGEVLEGPAVEPLKKVD